MLSEKSTNVINRIVIPIKTSINNHKPLNKAVAFIQPCLKNKKTVALIILALVVTFYAYQKFAPHFQGKPAGGAVSVGVAEVLERNVQQWHQFSGRLVAVDQVEIRPRVSGTIDIIHFKNGDMVKKGDLLFTIDPRPFRAEVTRAEGALASAQAQYSLTQNDLDRGKRLIKDKVIPKHEYDQRRNDYSVAAANLQSAKAALDSVKLNLEYTQIRSPIDGKVGRAEITEGNLIDAGASAPILTTVVSNIPIYADFEIDDKTFLSYTQAQVTDINDAKKIPVEMGFISETDTPHKGYIESFDNRLNTSSGTIRVRAVFDNADGMLVPGLFTHIKLGSASGNKVLLITDRAIGTDQNKKFVYVVADDNKVAYREIVSGAVADGLRVVESGLKAGEKIIVSGLQRARPGQQVTPEIVGMETKEPSPQLEKSQP